MTKRTRLSLIVGGVTLVLVLILGATAVFAQSDGAGEDAVPEDETPVPEQPSDQPSWPGHHGMPGRFGLPEGLTSKDELLADALNVDIDTLEEARETARVAAIEQALAEELITEEQAEMLLDGSFGFGFHRGHRFHGFGGSIDHEILLADALGISVEELQAAQQQAHAAALAELVDAGYLTEEDVELMAAREALKEAIDRDALLAEVLGITVAEVEQARVNRDSMAALIEDSGLSYAEVAEAMQAVYEAAVQQAIEDGVITAEQYEALQNAGPIGLGFGGHGRGGHGFGGHGRPGGLGGNGAFYGSGQPFGAPATSGTSI